MPEISPPAELQPWLAFPGSFMQKLRRHGILQPTVRVLSQRWRLASHAERETLGLPFRSQVLIRDVMIESGIRQWMFARSVFPHQSLTGTERQLARLKTRALGKVLFRHPHMHRSPFEFACLTPEKLREQFNQTSHTLVWSRHSVFTLRQKPLLLTEIFLSDFLLWLSSCKESLLNA